MTYDFRHRFLRDHSDTQKPLLERRAMIAYGVNEKNGHVIVDCDINPPGSIPTALWPAAGPNLAVSELTNATVDEPNGSTGSGPLSLTNIQLAPIETLVMTSAQAPGTEGAAVTDTPEANID